MKEASLLLDCNDRQVRYLIRTGRLPARKRNRRWRLRRKDVAAAVLHDLPKPLPRQHDSSYRLLFSHPKMVEDLIRGFFPEPWVDEIDFKTLEKMGEGYVSDRLDARWEDVVWKVRWRGQELHLCLLIEFQSTIDPYMAVRWMVYEALFYEDQIRQLKAKDPSASEVLVPRAEVVLPGEPLPRYHTLPPVIPIMIYNGKPVWWPRADIRDLVGPAPPGMEAFIPRLRYFALDQGRVPEGRLRDLGQNFVAALIRLEKSETPEELAAVLGPLDESLAPYPELRRAFAAWLRAALVRKGIFGIKVPEEVDNLGELRAMLTENMLEWGETQKQQGEAEVVLRLTERRFGPLDAATRRRIETAESDEI
ncbi:MAG: helix-turn-helix domain-containing protein, partial [bacterium]|nr:helix-turn-helix domain-containing protein [bacterium]